MEKQPVAMRLENWEIESRTFQHPVVTGEVYNHPFFPDGKRIYTSSIRDITAERVYTRNSLYELGRPALSSTERAIQSYEEFERKLAKE